MTTIHKYEGRTITEDPGIAGNRAFTVEGPSHTFILVGTDYGTPGPVTVIIGGHGKLSSHHVDNASRFGDRFNVEYVKRWIDNEREVEALMPTTHQPIEVPCPTCHVPAGEPCTQPTNTKRIPVTWQHLARHELAAR